MTKEKTYNNVLDICLNYVNDGEDATSSEDIFRMLLHTYFFPEVSQAGKKLEVMLDEMELPSSITGIDSLFVMNIDHFTSEINGETMNDSFSGKIMLSAPYLKHFYPHSTPSFSGLHDDLKHEVLERIKTRNSILVESFQKFHQDVEADRKRTVLTLVALIIKNIHQRTGRKLGKPKEPVKDIISRLYPSSSEIFSAAPGQMAQLKDDSSMKEMIKNFFPVKQFAEITDIATIFKDELSRYERRALNISSLEKG